MKQLSVIKVGGAVVEDEAQLESLLRHFSAIEGLKLLVHGGGRRATKVAAALGIESRMVAGRRITDAEMLEVVTMVYGGLINKNLVARLQACGVNALGLTGADIDIIRSHRRPPVCLQPQHTAHGDTPAETTTIDYGFVGDVDGADGSRLAELVNSGITPVVAPLTHDGQGHILNTNADTIASEVAKALAPYFDVTLIFAFEKPGVLANPDDDNSLIPVITPDSFRQLAADGIISGGMLPKIQNALQAVDAGVGRVIITKATAIDGAHGTVIQGG